MPDSPVVSVITPTLNQAQFLAHALQSVQAQTYPAVEHLVIDGGSTDGTLEILRRRGDAGTLRWTSEADSGMYEAVNKGLALASGEILAYLNSDDAYLPWALDSVVRAFRARPDVDLVYGDGIKVNETNGAQRLRLFAPFDRVSLANHESLMQPAVFWRRRLFERIGGFDARLRYVADLDYWLRAAAEGATILHVDEVIAAERIHPARLSSAQRASMAAEDEAMRTRHAGERGGDAGLRRARARDLRWQRWLWGRFLTAYALRPLRGPWPRFIRDGEISVKPSRAPDGSRPRQSRRLWNAVTSGRAADVLGVEGPRPARPRRMKAVLIRLRLLGLALPRLLTSGYGLLRSRFARGAGRSLRRATRPLGRAVKDGQRTVRTWRNQLALDLSYRFSAEGRRSRRSLAALRNSTAGRCVIIGNGPSLNLMDISVLKDVPTFGLNRGYLLFERIGGPTTYLVSVNRFVLEQSGDEMLASPCLKFFPWRDHRRVPVGRDDVVFIHTRHRPVFSPDIVNRRPGEGATVTFVAMQLAYHLGYREIVLIGVDHSFTTAGPAHKLVTSAGDDPNHFDKGYFGAGYRWQLPDLETSERAYRLARDAFEAAGGSVVDATVGGKLTVFPKADFTTLFARDSR